MRLTALHFTVLVALVTAPPNRLAAQARVDPSRTSLALGASFASSGPAVFGVHLQVGGVWAQSARVALRGDLMAQVLPSVVADPLCVGTGPCDSYALGPDQVYSAILSTEIRPVPSVPRLFVLAGFGAYNGRGAGSTNFGITGGASAGGGIHLTGRGGAGWVLEGRYHYLMHEFGDTFGMLTTSLGVRF